MNELEKASGIAVQNGQYMGLDVSYSDADFVVFPVPWDVTTSYRAGTVNGPEAVLQASYQLDFENPFIAEAWKIKVHTLAVPPVVFEKSKTLRAISEKYIQFLSEGGNVGSNPEIQKVLLKINQETSWLNQYVEDQCKKISADGKRVLILGGDHAVPLGSIQAASNVFKNLSVLHFDAHADLRHAYEGFQDSHASIMYNVIHKTDIKKLVQVGIRDVSPVEVKITKENPKVKTFFDADLQFKKMNGLSWAKIVDEIVSELTDQVYISFDIDGLDPKLCPHTGTPVPGGLEFWEAAYLIHKVVDSGKKVVGCDLVEVAPNPDNQNRELPDEWDANVGARVLFQMLTAMQRSL